VMACFRNGVKIFFDSLSLLTSRSASESPMFVKSGCSVFRRDDFFELLFRPPALDWKITAYSVVTFG
jgi:hypothetical protein